MPVILNDGLLLGGVRVIHHQQQHTGQRVPHNEFITTGLLAERLVCRQKQVLYRRILAAFRVKQPDGLARLHKVPHIGRPQYASRHTGNDGGIKHDRAVAARLPCLAAYAMKRVGVQKIAVSDIQVIFSIDQRDPDMPGQQDKQRKR